MFVCLSVCLSACLSVSSLLTSGSRRNVQGAQINVHSLVSMTNYVFLSRHFWFIIDDFIFQSKLIAGNEIFGQSLLRAVADSGDVVEDKVAASGLA